MKATGLKSVLAASLALSFLAASGSAVAQPTSQPIESCSEPITNLGQFVNDIAALTGGQPSSTAKYGPLLSCLDATSASRQVGALSAAKRKALTGQLLTALKDPSLTPQGKANAVGLLTELARKGLSERGAAGEYYFDALVEAAEAETDPVLRRQAALNLDSLSGSLTAAQKAKSQGLVDEFLSPKPPYETLFGANGEKTEVEWVIHGGDDTFAHGDWESVAASKGATIEKTGPGQSFLMTYTVTPDDPTGRLKPITYKVKVLDDSGSYSSLRAFGEMGNPNVAVEAYSYHSQYGRALRESLANAPASNLKKLYLLGACKAKVFRSRAARLYPNADFISTIDSEYFYDMSRSQMAMMEEFANRSTWEQIRRKMNRSGAGLLHTDNYQFPDDRRQLDHLDTDSDGIPDRLDTIMNFEITPATEGTSGFAPAAPVATDCTLNGDRLVYAATVANGIIGYSSKSSHLEDKFVSAGWGPYRADGPMFTFTEGKNAAGEKVFNVKTNPAYSHLDDTAMAAAMLHEFALKGLSDARRDKKPTEEDRIVALALGAKVMDAWSGSRSWNDYQTKFSTFDEKLNFWDVTSKIDHDNGVTRTTVDHITKLLHPQS